jgi:putative peptide zinc metalloprotease protein
MSTSAPTGAHFWQALAAVMGAAPEHPDTPQPVSPEPAPAPSGLWTWLATQVDPNNYRPARLPGIEVSRLGGREGLQYIIKNPTADTYLQLTVADWTLWRLMDGQHTVRDLVVEHFVRNHQFAYGRVLSLVRALREQRFLADQPVRVYDGVAAELDRRRPGFWGRRLARAFVESQYRLNGLDDYFTRLHGALRWVFWPPVQALLLLLLALAGVGAYVDLYLRGTPLVNLQGSYVAGALVLVLANFLVLIFHEHAHALTTKHFRREVRRGGFMLYYGFPAFFVDTMDIWLEPRGPRIAVTAAGPYANVLVGGACSLLAWAVGGLAGDLLFKVATVAYFGAVVNLNPLLELDGYFILIDWLEMPMLRQRSIEAVRALAANLLGGWLGRAAKTPAPEAPLSLPGSREGRIVLIYGVLTLLYSVYVLWLAVIFWQTRLWTVLSGMWAGASDWTRAALIVLLLAVAVPLGGSLAAWLWRQVESALEWLELRGFFDHNRNIAAIVTGFVVLVVAGTVRAPGANVFGWYFTLAPPALFATAGLACVLTSRQYAGSRFRAVWLALAFSAGLLSLGAMLSRSFVSPVWLLGLTLAPLGWFVAGLLSIAEHDLRRMLRWERLAMLVLLFAAPALALPWTRTALDSWMMFFVLLGAYSAPLGLALLVPTIAGFEGTRFSIPWMTLTLAMIVTSLLPEIALVMAVFPAGGYLLAGAYLLAAALWAAGALCAFVIGRRLQFPHGALPEQPALSDADRLHSGFARLVNALFDGFTRAFGRRFADDVDDMLDILSVTADWDVEIDNGRVNDELDLARMDVIAQGDRYREVLDATIAQMEERAGRGFVARAFAAAYDGLPWPEREALARYVLAGAPWGSELALNFSSGRSDRLLLLRGVPFFAGLNDAQFRTLLAALREVSIAADTVVARQGQPAERIYLVASGEIEAWMRTTGGERLAGELRRGAVFGKQALRHTGGIYSATYRASLGTRLFVLPRADLQPLLHEDAVLDEHMQSRVEELMLLGRMPLFGGLGPQALAELYARMGRRHAAPGEPIIRQGETRSSLFIILTGQVEVLARDAQGVEQITGRLGAGEHFGENALFADTVYGATVRAAPEQAAGVDLLTLDETTFDRLVASSAELASYVEQVASGRKIATSRRLAQPAGAAQR